MESGKFWFKMDLPRHVVCRNYNGHEMATDRRSELSHFELSD